MNIKKLIKDFKLPIKICKNCMGEGDISIFCGSHYMDIQCPKCNGEGYIKL